MGEGGRRAATGLAGRLTLGRAGAVVQVAGGGLLCFLCGSGEGQQESKVGQRTQGAAHGVPRRAHGHRGILSSREPTPLDPPHSPRLLRRHVGTVTQKQAQRPCGAGSQADLSQLPCGAGRGVGLGAAHLWTRLWTSQQRLQSSSAPDSTTRVPPTKSAITTTSST